MRLRAHMFVCASAKESAPAHAYVHVCVCAYKDASERELPRALAPAGVCFRFCESMGVRVGVDVYVEVGVRVRARCACA